MLKEADKDEDHSEEENSKKDVCEGSKTKGRSDDF